jgi:hypothetical protein
VPVDGTVDMKIFHYQALDLKLGCLSKEFFELLSENRSLIQVLKFFIHLMPHCRAFDTHRTRAEEKIQTWIFTINTLSSSTQTIYELLLFYKMYLVNSYLAL